MAKPEIRLKGFEGEWDTFKIGDITSIVTGATPSTTVAAYWNNGTLRWMSSGELNNKHIYDVKGRITEEGYNNCGTHIIPPYCILIGLAGQGKTRGTAAINHVELCTNQSIAALLPNIKIFDSLFLFHYMDNKYSELRSLSTGDGGRGGLNKQILLDFEVKLPSIEEQKAIALYFERIDNLIHYTTKKIESLKQMKQACLVSMFPQTGETTPRVRFSGFEGEWVNVTMGDVFVERHEISTITNELPQLSFTIEKGVIRPEDRKTNKRDFLIKDKSNKKYLVTYIDDVIYNPANVIYGAIHKNSLCNGVVSPIYKIFYTEQDPSFMECIVRKPEFIQGMTVYMEGTVQKLKTLKPEAFLQMSAIIAPSIEEQRVIGRFFKSLEKQIELQEQRLEKLKQIKASCLDKMFV